MLWWLQTGTIEVITTAYGEIQDIELPDGSKLTLNGNSTLRYDKSWDDPASREVWLEGEALFVVSKQPIKASKPDATAFAKFTVHTEELDIQVLGTIFSVNHRNQQTQVILSEGSVKVITPQQGDEDLIMQEGEMVNYANNQLQLLQVDTESQHSWKDELVIFKDIPVGEILIRLENTYGYRVEIGERSKLTERRFSGSFPRDSVEVLLDKLVKLYQDDIRIQDKTIVITD
jgi:ferric-dicitrate binding protein FerR (iron transport regulator)